MRRALLLGSFAAALAWFAGLPVAAQDSRPEGPIVPVYHEPHHRQVFQFGPTRILDLQLPPGDISWFHSHESPVLYVTLGTSEIRMQNLGEDWGGGAGRGGGGRGRAAGRGAPPSPAARQAPRATSTTSYAERPVTHRLENLGDGLFRAMVVINETSGDEATSVTDAGFTGEPELANRWFRAYRIALGPGEATPDHVHEAPVAVIQATDGTGLGESAMRWEFNEPSQWAFFDRGVHHLVRNTGDGPLELIEVELRGRLSP